LKVRLVNLLAALNFANVFKNKKKRLEDKKTLKNVKNVTKIKKNVKPFLHLCGVVVISGLVISRYVAWFARTAVTNAYLQFVLTVLHVVDKNKK